MRALFFLSWLDISTLKHLRFPFSFYLLPVFLFALSQAGEADWENTIIAFVVLHLFVFPSSNGYNSCQDRDTGSIGGLRNPPPVSRNLYKVTLLMDIVAVLLGFYISIWFALAVLLFVLISRAYSYRGIRIKKYPVSGFLTVAVFQGGFVYLMSLIAMKGFSTGDIFTLHHILCMGISTLFIGSMYPLTQIYQHESDLNDGVVSISYRLGYTGTFIFSAVLFTAGTILMCIMFMMKDQFRNFLFFLIIMIPVIVRLSIWFGKVKKSSVHADFKNTMTINLLTSACMNVYFFIIIGNEYMWF